MKWRLAESLKTLRAQIDTMAPGRSKKSDGSIGDAAHASRDSDHNPWVKDDKGQGVVTAIDVTHDPAHRIVGQELAERLIKDGRVKYVIFNRRIWKARTRSWEPYRGPNAHSHHVHVSVQPDPDLFDSKAPWPLTDPKPQASSRTKEA